VRSIFTSRNAEAAVLARALARLAPTELPILLSGETGVGKSFVATRIHRASRPGRPLVVIDCGAVPMGLLAGELFGHVAGAFTDASRARTGRLEQAADGTVVLDRVDALSPEAQVVLLRVLEERRFVPVGSSAARPLRARLVALAGEGLAARVARGEVRDDLYHRLAGFTAELPPLRRRPEDILPSARTVLRRAARQAGRQLALGREAESLLAAYPWPGNFRELATVLERAALVVPGGEVAATDLDLPVRWPVMAELAADRRLPLAEVTRLYGLAVLAREGGNVSRAARVLGVSRRTLIRWRATR